MNKILVYGGILIAIVIAVGGYFFPQVQKAFGAITPSTTTAQYATESTGAPLFVLGNAVTGPNSTGATGYTGNIQTQGGRTTALNVASTTDCTIANPFSASSTLLSVSLRLDTSSTSAQIITFATSTVPTASASTSPFFTSASVGAGAQALFTWDASSNSLVVPNGSVVITSTGGIGTFSNTGVCSAVFQSI